MVGLLWGMRSSQGILGDGYSFQFVKTLPASDGLAV